MNGRMLSLLAIVLAAVIPGFAQQATITLEDGRSVTGEIVGTYRSDLRLKNAAGAENDHLWSGIMAITSNGPLAIPFGEKDQVSGRIVGIEDGNTIVVETDALGIVRVPTSSLRLPPKPPETTAAEPPTPVKPTDWKGQVSLGGSVAAGNRDFLSLALDTLVEKNWTHDHLEFRLTAVYAKSEGREQNNSQSLKSLWRHYYEPTFYSYLSGEVARDEIQDILFRGLLNVGAGYEVWKDSDKELFDIEGGVGYRHESYEDDDNRNDATVRAAFVYKDIFFDTLEFSESLEILVPVNDPGGYLGRSETIFALPLSESWSFRTTIRIEYLGDPADGKEPLDLLATVGLEYRF